MLTATARKHIVRALRSALAIREIQAVLIMENHRNEWQLAGLDGDLRGIKALVIDNADHGVASLFLDKGRGYEGVGVSLRVESDTMTRWRRMPQDDAYAIAAEIIGNLYKPTIIEETSPVAANDDLDDGFYDMGPVPESRHFDWTDGTVRSVEIAASGDHVVAQVDLDEGGSKAMAMFPLMSDVHCLLEYATSRVDRYARLCVGRVNMFDDDVPAGFDRTMPVLDMIIPQEEALRIARTYRLRRAA